MAVPTRRKAPHAPKKYPDEIPPHQVIQNFFNNQPDMNLETEFMMLCRRNPSEYGLLYGWLVKNACMASIPQLKSWLSVKGIKAGTEAEMINKHLEEYAGLDAVGGLEAIAVRTAKISFAYGEIIQQKLDNNSLSETAITSIIAQYPNIISQTKQLLQALANTKEKAGERELLLAGADRLKSLVLGMLDVTSPHRDWLEKFLNAGIARIIEEI
jgi:hypothetical protein